MQPPRSGRTPPVPGDTGMGKNPSPGAAPSLWRPGTRLQPPPGLSSTGSHLQVPVQRRGVSDRQAAIRGGTERGQRGQLAQPATPPRLQTPPCSAVGSCCATPRRLRKKRPGAEMPGRGPRVASAALARRSRALLFMYMKYQLRSTRYSTALKTLEQRLWWASAQRAGVMGVRRQSAGRLSLHLERLSTYHRCGVFKHCSDVHWRRSASRVRVCMP